MPPPRRPRHDRPQRGRTCARERRNHVDEPAARYGSTDATVTSRPGAVAGGTTSPLRATRQARPRMPTGTSSLDADEWLLRRNCAARAAPHAARICQVPRVDSRFDTRLPASRPRRAGRRACSPRGVRFAGSIHEQPVHALPVRRLDVILDMTAIAPDALGAATRLLRGGASTSPGRCLPALPGRQESRRLRALPAGGRGLPGRVRATRRRRRMPG